eukprot:3364461-Pleurochrysis_carterae.AAC.1
MARSRMYTMVSVIRGNHHHDKHSCQSDVSDWAARVVLTSYLGPTYMPSLETQNALAILRYPSHIAIDSDYLAFCPETRLLPF